MVAAPDTPKIVKQNFETALVFWKAFQLLYH